MDGMGTTGRGRREAYAGRRRSSKYRGAVARRGCYRATDDGGSSMTTMKLHALPKRNAVLKEQFRFMGYGIRREAVVAAALLTLLSIGLAISVRLNGLTVDFQQEF